MILRVRHRAFTLLELIVVLVILALLAAIAIPTYLGVVSRSQDETAKTELSATLRDALALTRLNSDGVLTREQLVIAASEVALSAAGVSAASTSTFSVSSDAVSRAYGSIGYYLDSANQTAYVAMLTRSGNCVSGAVQGTGVPELSIGKSALCSADATGQLNSDGDPFGPIDPSGIKLTNLAATESDGQVTLSWPAVAGARGYVVWRDGVRQTTLNALTWTDILPNTPFGVNHSYVVAAFGTDASRVWPPSDPLLARAHAPIPQTMLAPNWTDTLPARYPSPERARVVLSWKPVPQATTYTLYRDGLAVWHQSGDDVTSADIEVSTGRNYDFTVTATSTGGTSPASPVRKVKAPVPPPGTATLTGQAYDAAAVLRWTMDENTTNSYTLKQDGVMLANVLTSRNGLVERHVGGLTNGITYRFSLSSSNSSGESGASFIDLSPAAALGRDPLPVGTPGAPTDDAYALTATGGVRQVVLSWNQLPGFTSYQVLRDGLLTATSTGNSYVDTGLVDDTTYDYRVVAYGNAGVEAGSATARATTNAAVIGGPGGTGGGTGGSGNGAAAGDVEVPLVPSGLTATPGVLSADVSWSPTPDTNSYRVYVDGVLRASTSNTSIKITSLRANTPVSITLSAANTGGESAQSAPVRVTPFDRETVALVELPAPLTGLTGSTSGPNALLSWDPSARASSYRVFRDDVLVATTNDTSITTAALPGRSSVWTTVGVNTRGSGVGMSITLTPAPAAPGLLATPGSGSVSLRLVEVAGAERYELTRDGFVIYDGPATTRSISGLNNGTAYSFGLTAISPSGVRSPVTARVVTPNAPPAPPSSLTNSVDGPDVTLVWSAAVSTSMAPVSGYRISENGVLLNGGQTGTSYTTQFSYNSTHTLVVQSYGNGGVSAGISTTFTMPPNSPTGIKAVAGDDGTSGGISWNSVTGADDYQLTRVNGQTCTVVYTGNALSAIDTGVGANANVTYSLVARRSGLGSRPVTAPLITPPATPVLSASGNDGSASLSWSSSPGANNYFLYRSVGSGEFALFKTNPILSLVDRTTENGTSYRYYVRAGNEAGTSTGSNVATVTPNVAPPAAVTGVTGALDTNFVPTVTWTKSGSAQLLGYTVYGSTDGGPRVQLSTLGRGDDDTAPATSWRGDTPVDAGTSTVYSVEAFNQGGRSSAVNSAAVIRVGAPSSPTALLDDPYDQGIALSWNASASSSARPVVGYRAYLGNSSTYFYQGSSTNALVDGLNNGTNYQLRVVSYNDSGESAPVSISSSPVPGWSVVVARPTSATLANPAGLFDALGKIAGGGTWVNPVTAGVISGTAASVSHQGTYAPGGSIDLGPGMKAVVTGAYTYGRDRNFNRGSSGVQGSNDNLTWTTITNSTFDAVTPSSNTTAWRYLRVTSTGGYYGEMELYGVIRSTSTTTKPSAPNLVRVDPIPGGLAPYWTGEALTGGLPTLAYNVYLDDVFYKRYPGSAGTITETVNGVSTRYFNDSFTTTAGPHKISVEAVNGLGEGDRAAKTGTPSPVLVTVARPTSATTTNPAGLFDALGKIAGGGTWVNPVTAGVISGTAASVSHQGTYAPGGSIDLGPGMKAVVTGAYTYGRDRNFNRGSSGVQGSNDNLTWTTITNSTFDAVTPSSNTTAWRYLRVTSTGGYYGEMELYGSVVTTELASLPTDSPTIARTDVGDAAASVYWNPMTSSGNLPVARYNVYVDGIFTPPGVLGAVTNYSETVNGAVKNYVRVDISMSNGPHTVQIAAANGLGEGPQSSFSVAPKAVYRTAARPANASVTIPAGIFNEIGKAAGNGTWINPITAGSISGNSVLVDHSAGSFVTSSSVIDLGPTLRVIVTGGYTNSTRYNNNTYNNGLQGSNDNVNWTDLVTSGNDSVRPVINNNSTGWRYIRFTGNYNNEMEVYGNLYQ